MKMRGHISVFGEYLMHEKHTGLVIPSSMVLGTFEEKDLPVHESYDPNRDLIRKCLQRRGFKTESMIRGDLPLGYGLASSTVLAFLHMGPNAAVLESLPVVNSCDEMVHGFPPSGMDSWACLYQVPGLYSAEGWRDVDLSPIPYTLLLFPPAPLVHLEKIRALVKSQSTRLGSLSDAMSGEVAESGMLNLNKLLEYSGVLLKLGVYSPQVEAFVAAMLKKGIVAKGIGGLYNKAVLVLWPTVGNGARALDQTVLSYEPTHVFEAVM